MELGLGEIVLIMFVALLVYGGRLPKVAAAVGRSLAELRRGLRETTDMVRTEIDGIDPRVSVRRSWQEARRALETSAAVVLPTSESTSESGDRAPAEVAEEDISQPLEDEAGTDEQPDA